jgi:TIR domain
MVSALSECAKVGSSFFRRLTSLYNGLAAQPSLPAEIDHHSPAERLRDSCPQMLRQAFISHTGQDNDNGINAASFATHLAERLGRAGISSFLDHKSLKPGEDWSDDINHHAQHSSVMVVVLSRSYFQRYWCMRELDLAISMTRQQQNQITILPVYYGIDDLGATFQSQQSAWQETWEAFVLAGKEGVDVQRWLANLQWLDQHCQGIRRIDTSKNSEVELEEKVTKAVFNVIPALLHEGFTVSLDDSSSEVQALLLDSPVMAIVGAGEASLIEDDFAVLLRLVGDAQTAALIQQPVCRHFDAF